MHTAKIKTHSTAGMTLVEVMIAGTICVMVTGFALGTMIAGLRTMLKDSQRLENNGSLRTALTKISTKAVDSTEFYLLTNYAVLDGNVDLTTAWPSTSNIAEPLPNAFDSDTANGDCLVLISRLNTSGTANISALRLIYRLHVDPSTEAPLRIYEIKFVPSAGSPSTPKAILDKVVISRGPGRYTETIGSTAAITTVTELAEHTLGRKYTASTSRFPIFSTQVPFPTPAQANVSINVEVVNGANQNNQISSSSFNYIISPRK